MREQHPASDDTPRVDTGVEEAVGAVPNGDPGGRPGRSREASTADSGDPSGMDWAALRERLQAQSGRQYWRSLEELADTPEFRRFLESEIPAGIDPAPGTVGRRDFLKVMGASMALAGVTACTRQPMERIYAYTKMPEEVVPGKPLYYATSLATGGVGTGVLVESHLNRPTKIEGNPEHPGSRGGTDAVTQAAVLGLYDPDRSKVVRYIGEIRPWSAAANMLAELGRAQRERKGRGLRILTESVSSPTLARQIRDLLNEMPEAKWHQWEPLSRDNVRRGAEQAFGAVYDSRYRVDRANVILALDADFLGCGPGHLSYVRDFAARRDPAGETPMNRLYVVEPTLSVTGASADHRQALPAHAVRELAVALARELGLDVRDAVGVDALRGWIRAVARDLKKHDGRSLVIAGDTQPADVHVLAHAINSALGNFGKTVEHTTPVEAEPTEQIESLRALVDDMKKGEVEALVVIGGNPVYDAPADLAFAEHLQKVGLRVHLGLYDDETAELCHWHIPQAHDLEAWGDVRAYDGTVSIVQPLIAPLYDGKTAHELLAVLAGERNPSAYDIVRRHWSGQYPPGMFERLWRKTLHDGIMAESALPAQKVELRGSWAAAIPAAEPVAEDALELVIRADPSVRDGRFANNAWLQELPKQITRLTWDNAALVSPAYAERNGLRNGDVLKLRFANGAADAPVWITPGQAERSVTVHLGYGRRRSGAVSNGIGFDAYVLRTTANPWFGSGLSARPTGKTVALASTQDHGSMEGRRLAREATVTEYEHHPHVFADHHDVRDLSLHPDHPYEGYAWGMTIDLNRCVGCGACVTACQSENNITVVGKEQVLNGREMHWIRVDRYYSGDPGAPSVQHQPVPCMHCEQAPCEVVCPVNATVHNDEGLNDMVYNRCVGTRYCSNNCPYKVRRFNYHLYTDWETEPLKMLRNPDVTVRSRGVMEKCTYCVQRINHARIEAKREGRKIRDGEVVTACQSACPAEAIVFGDINDPQSRVSQLKKDHRNYALLGEINTRPRTTYLGALRNPNPELEA